MIPAYFGGLVCQNLWIERAKFLVACMFCAKLGEGLVTKSYGVVDVFAAKNWT